jgi:hypothetical protein
MSSLERDEVEKYEVEKYGYFESVDCDICFQLDFCPFKIILHVIPLEHPEEQNMGQKRSFYFAPH